MTPASRTRPGWTLIEVLVAIAIMGVLMALLFPTIERARHKAYIVDCAANLQQIGHALQTYANDNHGALPRTGYDPTQPLTEATGAVSVDPFISTGPQPNDVTASAFLLLRFKLPPRVMFCPYNDVHVYEPEPADPLTHSNFTDVRKNLGYSFANMYPSTAAVTAGYRWSNHQPADFALAADLNPGKVDTKNDVLLPTPKSSRNEMMKANSENHERDGQNVLYADGHVAFSNNPFVGRRGDNIYTTADKQITASPLDTNDSVLLPTEH